MHTAQWDGIGHDSLVAGEHETVHLACVVVLRGEGADGLHGRFGLLGANPGSNIQANMCACGRQGAPAVVMLATGAQALSSLKHGAGRPLHQAWPCIEAASATHDPMPAVVRPSSSRLSVWCGFGSRVPAATSRATPLSTHGFKRGHRATSACIPCEHWHARSRRTRTRTPTHMTCIRTRTLAAQHTCSNT